MKRKTWRLLDICNDCLLVVLACITPSILNYSDTNLLIKTENNSMGWLPIEHSMAILSTHVSAGRNDTQVRVARLTTHLITMLRKKLIFI